MVNITVLSYGGMTVGCILEVGGPIIHRLHYTMLHVHVHGRLTDVRLR